MLTTKQGLTGVSCIMTWNFTTIKFKFHNRPVTVTKICVGNFVTNFQKWLSLIHTCQTAFYMLAVNEQNFQYWAAEEPQKLRNVHFTTQIYCLICVVVLCDYWTTSSKMKLGQLWQLSCITILAWLKHFWYQECRISQAMKVCVFSKVVLWPMLWELLWLHFTVCFLCGWSLILCVSQPRHSPSVTASNRSFLLFPSFSSWG